MMNIKVELPQWFKSVLIKSSLILLLTRTKINFKNQKLAEKLQKAIIRKFKKCEVYSSLKGNTLSADLEDI